MTLRQPISEGSEWSFELIEEYHRVIRMTAERFNLDTYPNPLPFAERTL